MELNMSSKITELKYRAWDVVRNAPNEDNHPFSIAPEFEEVFAKMIIQECVDHIMTSSDRYRRDYFAAMLKEHFEVK
jgi:hypothetical protein